MFGILRRFSSLYQSCGVWILQPLQPSSENSLSNIVARTTIVNYVCIIFILHFCRILSPYFNYNSVSDIFLFYFCVSIFFYFKPSNEIHKLQTRNAHKLNVIRVNNNYDKSSLKYKDAKIYNELPNDIVYCKSLNIFKNRTKKYYKSFY